MKTLYLLRHAHTFGATPPLMRDYERILSPQGTEEALAVGKFMQERDMYPDFVLGSSAVRTIQTARLVFGALFSKAGIKISSHFDRRIYQASDERILSEIQKMDASIERLLVVGHNPGVADLAALLMGGETQDYDPGTLTIFKADCRSWADFLPEAVRLEQVFIPNARAA